MTATTVRYSAFILALASAATASAAGPDMRPGLWELTTRMEMPGMPMAMPAMTVQHCYSEADIAQGEKSVQPGGDNENHCKVSGYSLQGNTASWTMQCDNMSGQGTMTYAGDSYSGVNEFQMGKGSMKQTISARRIGDCGK